MLALSVSLHWARGLTFVSNDVKAPGSEQEPGSISEVKTDSLVVQRRDTGSTLGMVITLQALL